MGLPQMVQHLQQTMQEGAALHGLDMSKLLTSHPDLLKVSVQPMGWAAAASMPCDYGFLHHTA